MMTLPLILIVDDVLANRKVLEAILKKEGFQVAEASSGEACRKLAKELSPSLIMLDIMMPNENGFETCQKLKKDPETANIPIIFLSALDDVENKVKGLTIGGADYITKPFEKEEVLARVRIQLKVKEAFDLIIEKQVQKLKEFSDAQQAILTNPDDIPEAKFSVAYHPLKEIGGDFYEVFSYSDFHAYFIGDICGHDIKAGFISASLKNLLKQNAGPMRTPTETLSIINRILISTVFEEGQYLTGQYVLVNRKQQKLTLINAGHPPLLHVPKSGAILAYGDPSDILGIFDSASFAQTTIEIKPDDKIILFTDGILHGENLKKDLQEILFYVERHRQLPRDSFIQNLYHDMTQGKEKTDDQTLIVIEI